MTTGHSEVHGREHLPGDGRETVEHEDHIDHLYGDERHAGEKIHVDHPGGPHAAGDGCETVEHGDHLDHVHDGHRHYQHGDHVHEH